MKKLLFLLLLFFVTLSLHAQEDVLEQKIQKMMAITGASERFSLVMDELLAIQEDSYKDVISKEFFDSLKKEIKNTGFDEVISMIIPIYKEHLTEVEIDAIIAFYESEEGQSMLSKLPIIMQKSMAVGEEWGGKLANDIIEKIENSDEAKFNIVLEDCDKFKEGKFSYQLQLGGTATVTRKDGMQTEDYESGKFKGRIEWVTNCSYRLYELNENNEERDTLPLDVNIYEINGDTYKYISKKEGISLTVKGEMTKISD